MNGAVVLIDENEEARAWALAQLQSTALPVQGFATAADFLSSLSLPGPACVVIDARLPDMTCRQLQAELQRRGLRSPLVCVVDAHQVELAVGLLKGGAADVLARPLDADELRRRVHAVVMAAARAQSQAHVARERLGRLTQRELEVVMLATAGLSNKDIAEQLRISFRTVEVHRRNALRKTGSANVVELTHFVGNAARDPRVAEAARRFELAPRGARPALAAHAVGAPRASADTATPNDATAQLSLWSTGEPVRTVQSSETERRSLP